MISKINDRNELNGWKLRDLFSTRILALLESYGTQYDFATFYKQTNANGDITAVLSRLDDNITLALEDEFDETELIRFFCITGYNSILSSDDFEKGSGYEEGMIMACSSKSESDMTGVTFDEYPKLMDLYNFIDYDNQNFDVWYVDISHRIRHNTAKAYTLNVNDSIISSGILSSIYEKNAVLTAVRTSDEFRNMGYGSALVKYICSDIKGTVFLMRDMNRNESFYTRLGFRNTGKWRMYK